MKRYLKIFLLSLSIFVATAGFCSVNAYSNENIKNDPKLSVIIPVYNTERYLATCLDSVINQNFKDIEIICVNDGSTDNSLKVLEEYAEKDSRIKIVIQKNSGVSEARNRGLEESSAQYVTFVDSDDYVDPKIYEKGYNAITSNDADVYITCESRFYDGAKNLIKENPYNNSRVYVYGNGVDTIGFPRKNYSLRLGVVWDKIYRKSIITDNNFKFEKDVNFGEDTIFNWILFTRVKKVVKDDNRLYFYRTSRKDSLMGSLNIYKRIENYIAIAKHLVEEYNKTNYFKGAENWVEGRIFGLNYSFLLNRFKNPEEQKYYINKFLKNVDEPYFKKHNFNNEKIRKLRSMVADNIAKVA